MDMRSDTHTQRCTHTQTALIYMLLSAGAVQYAFLVTSVVQFAGGVVVFFGLLVSPKEVGK